MYGLPVGANETYFSEVLSNTHGIYIHISEWWFVSWGICSQSVTNNPSTYFTSVVVSAGVCEGNIICDVHAQKRSPPDPCESSQSVPNDLWLVHRRRQWHVRGCFQTDFCLRLQIGAYGIHTLWGRWQDTEIGTGTTPFTRTRWVCELCAATLPPPIPLSLLQCIIARNRHCCGFCTAVEQYPGNGYYCSKMPGVRVK